MLTEAIANPSVGQATTRRKLLRVPEHTVEIVSDAGEGAQKCGQIFGAVSAKMGNGVWTVEIIPAEIQPPPRVPEGASGYRIRIGDAAGHQLGRRDESRRRVQRAGAARAAPPRRAGARRGAAGRGQVGDRTRTPTSAPRGSRRWPSSPARHYRIIPVPMEERVPHLVDNPRKGKNMFALGMLACIYGRDMDRIEEQIAYAFRKKSEDGVRAERRAGASSATPGPRSTSTSGSRCAPAPIERARWW